MWYSERRGVQIDGRHLCLIAPTLASNECDYEKMMYKRSGLMTLCRKKALKMIGHRAICFCILKSRYYRSQKLRAFANQWLYSSSC